MSNQAKTSSWGNDLYTGKRSYNIVGSRKILYTISIVLCIISFAIIGFKGLNLGIEFKGGSEFKVNGVSDTSQELATDAIKTVEPDMMPMVTNVGQNGIRVQMDELSDETQVNAVRDALATAYNVQSSDITNTLIGPSWGKDVSTKSFIGLGVFLLVVSLFMTIYFRNWRMAASGITALLHDLVITVGVYALIGWEITPASMIGFLTILGYSMYDTVVIFDKVRENTADVLDQTRVTYAERANLALNQTLVRSINTSVVALLPVASILFIGSFLLGAGTLRDIALALFVGTAVGTYSSIFLATPLEVSLRSREEKIQLHDKKVLEHRKALLADINSDSDDSSVMTEKELALAANATLLPGKRLGNATTTKGKRKKKK
jgi:preprotein translocase subunit SecF